MQVFPKAVQDFSRLYHGVVNMTYEHQCPICSSFIIKEEMDSLTFLYAIECTKIICNERKKCMIFWVHSFIDHDHNISNTLPRRGEVN